ncbi:MAG: homocysteine S-methyltransferase family protein [Lachnospiraceae bacterium]|nr:homocysteine S-methyltransferase family protein [Lachnospiraceae bacterium]
MTKEEFQKLAGKYLILDGATGSNLQKAGMPSGICPEAWILEHPQALMDLQRQFVEAGSNIVYAPTFTGNRIKLAEYDLQDSLKEINTRLVQLSKEAVAGKALVAGDLTMTGRQLAPLGDMDFEELIDVYKEQISALTEAGADLLVVETMMSLQECRAALIAAKETCDLPVMVTMTFESDGRCLFGTDAETAMVVLQSLGADAVGANCSTGPKEMAKVIASMKKVAKVPVIAKPNAGLPKLDADGNTVYEMTPADFGEQMKYVIEAGATIVGGCCGNTPEHIRNLTQTVAFMEKDTAGAQTKSIEETDAGANGTADMAGENNGCGIRYLTSERQTLSFGLDGRFMIVGERINPTGKKKFQQLIREGDFSKVEEFVTQQEERGARVLDVNMGMSGIDEKETLLAVMEQVTTLTSLPLSIDTSDPKVCEAVLRRYPGRALINSVSFEQDRIENMLPLAKKYGAMFILLPVSDEGLPKDLDEKKQIIQTVLEKAYALGLTKEDVVVDGLVGTVGANPKAALETLETIRWCKSQGLATICGLSNISFGLPQRSFVNSAFLTMAIQTGLTMAIANPNQDQLTAAMYAADLLLAKEEADIAYIDEMNRRTEEEAKAKEEQEKKDGRLLEAVAMAQRYLESIHPTAGSGMATAPVGNAVVSSGQISVGTAESVGQDTVQKKTAEALTGSQPEGADPQQSEILEKVRNAVLKGNKKKIADLTKDAHEGGIEPRTILNTTLLPAIQNVGELFDQGKYFLPQLIASAESMKLAIEYLEPFLLQGEAGKSKGTVVIATVEGDIHDIGKNLVALMLKNYGFKVIDLGKDVPKETIVDTALAEKADIIGLSALMTTTMQQMRDVVQYAREKDCNARIMIGGAVITPDYASEIGADAYSSDAADAVKVAENLLKESYGMN